MTPTEMAKAILATAADGEFIIPKDFVGPLYLKALAGVTIRHEPGGRLGPLTLYGCSDVTLIDVAVQLIPSSATPLAANVVRIVNSQRINIRGGEVSSGPMPAGIGVVPFGTPTDDPTYAGKVEGLPVGRGIVIDNSSEIVIEGVDIHDVHKGICPGSVDGFTTRLNHIHDIRTSMITGGKVQRAVVEWNHLHDSKPYRTGSKADDHCDFIHLWTGTAASPGVQCLGYRIRDNLMDQGAGYPMIGIQLDDNGTGAGFSDVELARNALLTSHGTAIRLENVSASKVVDNVLLQVTDPPFTPKNPSIYLNPLCRDIVVTGNTACDIYKTFQANPGNTTLPPGPRPAEELATARKDWLARVVKASGGSEPDPRIAVLEAQVASLSSSLAVAAASLVESTAEITRLEAERSALAAKIDRIRAECA